MCGREGKIVRKRKKVRRKYKGRGKEKDIEKRDICTVYREAEKDLVMSKRRKVQSKE